LLRSLHSVSTGVLRRAASTQALVLERVSPPSDAWKGKISVRSIDVEEPFTPYDLRIDIRSVGICGSDVHYYKHGSIGPFVVKEPMILGHEAAGVVTQVGAAVQDKFKVGDRVCMEPGVPDNNSVETRLGQYNVCRKLRFWATPPAPYATNLHNDPAWKAGHGCLRPSVVHPASFTYKIPNNVSYHEGAMVEPLAVGMHAATKAKVKPGDRAVVLGAGPIGMMMSVAALAAGCAKIIISDVSQEKLKIAEGLAPGKIIGVNIKSQNLQAAVMQVTDGWGADIIFECSGQAKAANEAPLLACPGGKAVFIGCPSSPLEISVGDMQVRELETHSTFRYAHVYPKAIALLESGSINLKPIITNVFPLTRAVEAFDFMCKPPPTTVKSVIVVSEDK
jgi:D-xylulose reductase